MSIYNEKNIISPSQQVGKFYFLDYFFILLKSVSQYPDRASIFGSFKYLKNTHQLGVSKYKKLTKDDDELTNKQLVKYEYTFQAVLGESRDYGLINIENNLDKITLTSDGQKALYLYEQSKELFNNYILYVIEKNKQAFYDIIKMCYNDTSLKNGLLIFPIYSGLKLGFDKSSFTSNKQVYLYSRTLRKKLESDISIYTNKQISLELEEQKLLQKLIDDDLIKSNPHEDFDTKKYYMVLSRFRKYWLNYFLKEIYNYPFSYSTFSIWIERAKQIGIIYTTEFYPNFSGRIVYPTSIIRRHIKNIDFKELFTYSNKEKLYLHYPNIENNINQFVTVLHQEFILLQSGRKTHFINLADLKERVCFKMRLPQFIFDTFLEYAYNLNLKGKLPIQISLEADKLPQETKAMYLNREPILVNGKYKNIISINYNR